MVEYLELLIFILPITKEDFQQPGKIEEIFKNLCYSLLQAKHLATLVVIQRFCTKLDKNRYAQ